ncbi:MAG: hypothetical protein AB7H53_18310 [Hyphomicrobium sp.]
MDDMRNGLLAILLVAISFLPSSPAFAASCQDSLPIDERELTQDEVRECLKPRAEVIVAFKLLGEKELSWKDFGEIHRKCVAGGDEALSDDPVVWAGQVSTCPSPKTDCGCSVSDFAGSRFMPDPPEAASVRDKNLALIKREGALLTRQAFDDCEAIRSRLEAVQGVKIKRKCKNLR